MLSELYFRFQKFSRCSHYITKDGLTTSTTPSQKMPSIEISNRLLMFALGIGPFRFPILPM